MSPELLTQYAPAERASKAVVAAQSAAMAQIESLRPFYDAVTEAVILLNAQRQIVFCNDKLAKMLGVDDPTVLLGLRPGEAVDCAHSADTHAGCGTTDFCSTCGAVNAILAAQHGAAETKECRILRKQGDALDLRVAARAITLNGLDLTVCAISDISHEKRRRSLERVFFHDLMNTVTGIQMYTELLEHVDASRQAETRKGLARGIRRLVEEIKEQRDLTAAERSDLAVQPASILAGPFVNDLVEWYSQTPQAKNRQLRMSACDGDIRFRSDPTLLGRVVGNMIKNALEATPVGGEVTVGCQAVDLGVEFSVHNATVMPRDAQLQVFQRSFSTKGVGRGLGTYSMKLLTEKYLKGSVSFTSSEEEGTTFRAHYPLDPG